MKLLFVMDPLARLQIAGDTTFAIMLAAQARGHEIWFCEPRHLSLEHADAVARAWPVTVRRVVGDHYLLGPQATVPLASCNVVFMRKDPPFDLDYYFATLMLERARGHTLIINDPRGLREQNEKLAVLEFPELCPPTIVTREGNRLRSFLAEQGGEMVVKPLDASGGFGVFHVRRGDPNTGAILEQSTNLGRRWIMAQKYLPEVRRGDKRILLVDGVPLCAVLRVPAPDDARGNLHVGAKPMATKLDDRDQAIVARARPLAARAGTLLRRPGRDRRLAHRGQRHQPHRHPRGERALRRRLRGQGARAPGTEDRPEDRGRMIRALRAPAACVALFAVACGASRAAAADGEADRARACLRPSDRAARAAGAGGCAARVQAEPGRGSAGRARRRRRCGCGACGWETTERSATFTCVSFSKETRTQRRGPRSRRSRVDGCRSAGPSA